jgi:hypothetical protein
MSNVGVHASVCVCVCVVVVVVGRGGTHPTRKNKMTEKMESTHGTNTPKNVESLPVC